MKVTKEMIDSEVKGISLRYPEKLHNFVKAEAALLGLTKDEFFKRLTLEGFKNYNHETYKE